MLVLGAGLAGLTAALELSRAGYKVQVLEYQHKAGGRNISIRGGDTVNELGGFTQHCQFDPGFYVNPGPMRIPYHHVALLDYCKRLNVTLEPFSIINYNAMIHNSKAFGGKPKRYREVESDFRGYVSELLAKTTPQGKLDQAVTKEDAEMLMTGAAGLGRAGQELRIQEERQRSPIIAAMTWIRAAGCRWQPTDSEPMAMSELLQSRLWTGLLTGHEYEYQMTMFQPVGGMDRISAGFVRALPQDMIKYNCKVTEVKQDASGVTVSYVDAQKGGAVADRQGQLVRQHHSHHHPQPGADADRRAAQERHQLAVLQRGLQGGRADEAPLVGRRLAHLWRHHLYRPAHRADLLSVDAIHDREEGRRSWAPTRSVRTPSNSPP